MPDEDLEVVWSSQARLTFERMPPDVQKGLLEEFSRMALRYKPLYDDNRPADIDSVGTVSHMQVPGWNIWLRIDTGYLEDEGEPVLFVNELDELSKAEVEDSIAKAHANPDKIATR